MSTGISAGDGASGFQLGDAANYGIIAFDVHNFSYTSDSYLTGNLAIGTMGGNLQGGNGTINGSVTYDGANQSTGLASGSPTGGTITNDSEIGTDVKGTVSTGTIIGDLAALSTTVAGYGGQAITWSSSALSLTPGSGANAGSLVNGNYVYSISGSGFQTQNNTAITITASASQYVIINVAEDNKNIAMPTVNLVGGITSDHVLFNYTGTGQVQLNHNGASAPFQGTFLAPNAKYSLDGGYIIGRVFGGGAGQDFQFVSNVHLTAPPACFFTGTLIATPAGERAIETLKVGDLVLAASGEAKPVLWIGRQSVSPLMADPLKVLPICVRAGALGENLPKRDLRISSAHALLIDDVLIQAGALVNGQTIVREVPSEVAFTYWHLELEDHDLVIADGVPAETFVANVSRETFDNWAEHEALFPNGRPYSELTYPRAQSQRQTPPRIRLKIAEIAADRAGLSLVA